MTSAYGTQRYGRGGAVSTAFSTELSTDSVEKPGRSTTLPPAARPASHPYATFPIVYKSTTWAAETRQDVDRRRTPLRLGWREKITQLADNQALIHIRRRFVAPERAGLPARRSSGQHRPRKAAETKLGRRRADSLESSPADAAGLPPWPKRAVRGGHQPPLCGSGLPASDQ